MLTICTCGYVRRIPKLRNFILTEKKGFSGIFYKGNISYFQFKQSFINLYLCIVASVIGTRLNKLVCLLCFLMAIWLIFLR
jgi:hypothetical protein